MRDLAGLRCGRCRGHFLLVAVLAFAFSTYVEQVASLPAEAINQWPTFPRRNIAALARAGYLKNSGASGFKRSISTLAKNGQLPTFRSPYLDGDKQDQDDEDSSQEKRNMASIARLRSYAAMKRNIQALARDGYRVGRGQYNQPNDKRNIAALARNGMMIHKRDDVTGDEYFYPFYQNPIPPLSDIDGPFDFNEVYDYQQSVNPDMFPPLSQVYKRNAMMLYPESVFGGMRSYDENMSIKRGAAGLPAFGLYRPNYVDPTTRTKRYILDMPDVIETNDIDKTGDENEDKRSVDEEVRDNFEKRHIGSLARLGLLPSFRFSGGRYSRSGRARLLMPGQELYRKYSNDENIGIRKYIPSAQVEPAVDPDDANVPPPPVLAHSHPTGRLLHRPLNNDIPNTNYINDTPKTWKPTKHPPQFYYFRSLKVPYHASGKRYLILPAVDNILLRKGYRNSSLPSRRKNQ